MVRSGLDVGVLKRLNNRLDSPFCSYAANAPYPIIGVGKQEIATASEVLTVSRQTNVRETVDLVCFDDAPSLVVYASEDARQVKKVLGDMRLPSSSGNLGEVVFRHFMVHMELEGIDSGPVYLENRFSQGSEGSFELVLRRLAHVYSGNKINQEFYQSLKQL